MARVVLGHVVLAAGPEGVLVFPVGVVEEVAVSELQDRTAPRWSDTSRVTPAARGRPS